jgi:NADPH2:quinone reductase
MEGAGIVEAVGEGVTHLKAGDRAAYASHPPGAYSQARVMPAKCVCKLPDVIDFETGAAMMLKGLTAQYLLKRVLPQGGLQKGDFVLFHAVAGGVGLIAVQWAKHLGLQLIGTAGTDEKCALAKSLGAAHVINYQREDFAARVKEITGGQGVKVVYDSVGKDTWDKSMDCLRPFGLMASFGNASGPVPPFAPGILGPKGSIYVTRQTLFHHIATRETTQEMADDLGVSRTTISKYEHDATGKRGVPRMAIFRYADVSGIPLEWIETGTTDSVDGGSTENTWTPSTAGQDTYALPDAA